MVRRKQVFKTSSSDESNSEVNEVPPENNLKNTTNANEESKNSACVSSMQPLNTAIKLQTQNSNLLATSSENLQPCNLNEINTSIGEINEICKPSDKNFLKWNLSFPGKREYKIHFDKNLKKVSLLSRYSKGYTVIKNGSSLLDYHQLVNSKEKRTEKPLILQKNLPCNTISKLINFEDTNNDKKDIPHTITNETIIKNNDIETNNYKCYEIYPLLADSEKLIQVLSIPEFGFYNLNWQSLCTTNQNTDDKIPHTRTDTMEVYKRVIENKFKIKINNNGETCASLSRCSIYKSPVTEFSKNLDGQLLSTSKCVNGRYKTQIRKTIYLKLYFIYYFLLISR